MNFCTISQATTTLEYRSVKTTLSTVYTTLFYLELRFDIVACVCYTRSVSHTTDSCLILELLDTGLGKVVNPSYGAVHRCRWIY